MLHVSAAGVAVDAERQRLQVAGVAMATSAEDVDVSAVGVQRQHRNIH